MEKIKMTVKNIDNLDDLLMQKAQERLNRLTKPQGSLGRLEELAKLVVGITRKEKPAFKNKVIFTLAADHGVTEEKVSAYPKEVTAQMVYNFLKGGAGINVLAKHVGAKIIVVDMGVAEKIMVSPSITPFSMNSEFKDRKINFGTKNMVKGPAMTREEAIKSIETGIEVFEEEYSSQGGSASGGKNGIDIIGTGDMGIGNTTSSSAITAVFTGQPIAEVTGKGTGIDDDALKNKIKIIKKAIELNKPNPKDPIDVLSKIGGFEIGGLSGIILAAASRKVPVVIDGFISGASALIAYHLEPKAKNYFIASHYSVEKGHSPALEHLGLLPLLDLNLRLGEGTGAALGMSLVEASVKILTQMATFEDAGVSDKNS